MGVGKQWLWGGILTTLVVAIIFYVTSRQSPSLKPTHPLVLADGGSTLSSLMYVAYYKTFFRAEGLEIHYSPHSSGRDSLQALIRGEADIATAADTPIVRAMLAGESFQIVATIGTSGESTGIVAHSQVATPEQLAGHRVGFVPGTNSEYFLDEFLIKHGIDKALISRVPISPDDAIMLMRQRKIDAVSIFDPIISRLQIILPEQVKVFYAPELYSSPWNLVVSPRLAEQPELIDRILKTLLVAEQFVTANPEISADIASRYLRLSAQEIRRIWPKLQFNIALKQSLVVSLERQITLLEQDKEATIPNILSYFYTDSMQRVMPDRVTIIR